MNDRPILIVQPPTVQLNAPYPAPYYLKSFLASRGLVSRVADHSIDLFHAVFSCSGLRRIFADARPSVSARLSAPYPQGKNRNDEESIRYNLSRFLSQEKLWVASIDRVVAFLRGQDREFGHLLAAANGALPGGPRLDAFFASVDGDPACDDAARIASLMIADLADFIRVSLDPTFSPARYAASMAASVQRFSAFADAVDGYTLSAFYEPILEAEWDRWEKARPVPTDKRPPRASPPLILACTVPFPGCLAGALAAARSAKARFGDRVRTIAGGGYVNTELRHIRAAEFFDYFDYLSFDRGYGSLEAILEAEGLLGSEDRGERRKAALYKTIYRDAESGALVGSPDSQAAPDHDPDLRRRRTDDDAVTSVFPDYRTVDFSRYILPLDDANPMHRLWSDGRWLKAYLAHGCYWHSCAFCDVKLDYIRGYAPVDVDALFRHLCGQAEAVGVRGVHLVDEAAPVASLLRLAELNRAAGLPLVFWGNIRFEREFTSDVAAVLAAGGLLGVSAGIEVASERGFKRLGKGLSLVDVVRACAAFKEAGILTHAYLIYGFWDEDDGEIVDSAETMRQLFAAGLVDSAFWHKFVLTRHSRIYAEWERGRHPTLRPIEHIDGTGEIDFADNDLRYVGENRSDRFTAPLDALLASWMAGEALDDDVRTAFPFPVPAPTVAPDTIETALNAYAWDRERGRSSLPQAEAGKARAVFLGGAPIRESRGSRGRVRIAWRWRLDGHGVDLEASAAEALVDLLGRASAAEGIDAADFAARLADVDPKGEIWPVLRAGGLAVVPARTSPHRSAAPA